ncbi:SNF2 family N-terminal domain-domain-containing protein [Protomyces lactucae-debilis]|uniref:SNF2 family N-terminal domain-domain-containing protein n=1 Tax=Protomyces lactucae-debilis TaxID=2754530 RepID=A0A1Y2FS60_PROLT|nr:SNF2 family N-terminal domain-containing protein [Protomyces lactucae-debilis]ORY86134.1 SNF2 family N-terminal domain-domain-containing protein [Protomyces lactucae-debilis]
MDPACSGIKRLFEASDGHTERAINMFFDGSWQQQQPPTEPHNAVLSTPTIPTHASTSGATAQPAIWKKKALGAFGTQGYMTCSTRVAAGQKLLITRQSSLNKVLHSAGRGKPPKAGRMHYAGKLHVNSITRFCSEDGTELGRLPQDVAVIVSTLLDLDMCTFEATCIYAPDRVRTGTNVDLQITCFIRKRAFQQKTGAMANHISVDDSAETAEEKMLKLRRFALVKLFGLIGVEPLGKGEDNQMRQVMEMTEATMEPPKKPPSLTQSKSTDSQEEAEDGTELQADQLDSLYRKAQTFDQSMPGMDPADTFAFTLKPYQRQALHWMYHKELHDAGQARKSDSLHPLWSEYLFQADDTASESFYMNPYSGELSLEFPKAMDECRGGILADEMGLGKTIEILSLVHTAKMERAEADPSMPLTKAPGQRCHTTLVVAPLTLISQWQSEAENASKEGTLKVLLYYGTDKSIDLNALCNGPGARHAPDMIITSYGVVLSEWLQREDGKPNNGLFAVDFHRVVLDEAHTIKNRQAKTSKACYSLKATRRWALTGTPIVNKLEDLFSLVHFLTVEPWGHFSFWRTFITIPFESKDYIRALDVVQTVLEPLVLRRTKDMRGQDGRPIVDLPPKQIEKVYLEFSEKERAIYNFISARARRTYVQNAEAGTVMKNYSMILGLILRLRQACCDPTLVHQRVDVTELPADEQAVKEDDATDLLADVSLKDMIEQFASGEAHGEQEASHFGATALQQIMDEAENECPICSAEPMEQQTVARCFHSACKSCFTGHIKFMKDRGEEPLCHTCRKPVSEQDLQEVIRYAQEGDQKDQVLLRPIQQTEGSAKVDALLHRLQETKRATPNIKSVVFSQFTSFLDLIGKSLRRHRLQFVRLDGSMSLKERALVLEKFRSAPANMTLIISLKAGGVGLNLTSANHVYMLDPWWSFAIEAQAIDRIHRMGQTRDVSVYRFIIKNSVEEKMLKIQDRKNFLASSLGMSKEEKKRETMRDIELLFED